MLHFTKTSRYLPSSLPKIVMLFFTTEELFLLTETCLLRPTSYIQLLGNWNYFESKFADWMHGSPTNERHFTKIHESVVCLFCKKYTSCFELCLETCTSAGNYCKNNTRILEIYYTLRCIPLRPTMALHLATLKHVWQRLILQAFCNTHRRQYMVIRDAIGFVIEFNYIAL